MWSHTVHRHGTTCTVALSGEIDMSVGEAVLAMLTDALGEPGTTTVRVDLAGVSFLGSAGLHALVRARTAAERAGRVLVVTGAKGSALDVLDISGLLWLLADDDTGTAG